MDSKRFSAKGKKQSLFWESSDQTEGGSRFYGGHHCNWAIDGYRTLVMNTIAWPPASKFPGRRPDYKVTEDELNEQLDDYGRPLQATEADLHPGPWMTPRNTPLPQTQKEEILASFPALTPNLTSCLLP